MADDSEGPAVMVLGFSLAGGQLCGFPISAVQEVLQMVELTPMPDSPPYVIGAINLRGSVLPVIDMAMLIGLPVAPYTLDTPIVVIAHGDGAAGLIVEDVQDVMEVGAEDVDTPTDVYPMRRLLSGVARTDEGLLMVFDIEQVMGLAAGASATATEGRRPSETGESHK